MEGDGRRKSSSEHVLKLGTYSRARELGKEKLMLGLLRHRVLSQYILVESELGNQISPRIEWYYRGIINFATEQKLSPSRGSHWS